MIEEKANEVADVKELTGVEALDVEVDLKKMTRKIDMRLLPLLFITYSIQFMDKVALSASSVFGIKEDNHLVGQDYSWVSSIFYFGYMGCQPLAARSIQVAPPGRLLAITVFLWGIILACSAATHSYAGQLLCRFFLGCTEAFVSPICMHLSSSFYTETQQPLRVGIWFSGNDFGGILSSFIAFGLGHIKGHLLPWKYIFIVYGCLSLVWGLVLFVLLPDSPNSCRFLSLSEKAYFERCRPQSRVDSRWTWSQFTECMLDMKSWLIVALVVLNILPNGGIISYGFIIIESFGFSNIETTILNVPTSVITWIAIVSSGYISTRIPNSRCLVIAGTVILPVIGAVLVYSGKEKGVKLVGYFFLCVQPSTFPNVLALSTSNFRSSQKRITMAGIIFVFYCGTNIAAPQLFRSDEYPNYPTAFKTWIICLSLTILVAVGTRLYLKCENQRKQKRLDAGETPPEGVITDKQNLSLRYCY